MPWRRAACGLNAHSGAAYCPNAFDMVTATGAAKLSNKNASVGHHAACVLLTLTACTDCAQVLLEGGATIELQDALGRSALMFAAGSDATAACNVLLEAHASLSARDRRGRAALDYAPAGQ
jgi:hypothetical protein